jgi:hypothetical protein
MYLLRAASNSYVRSSLIENSCNREAKEHWFWEHHPKRAEAAVRVHAWFVFLCMALVVGFRLHTAQREEAERRGQDMGITRYRRELEQRNRNRVVVFQGQRFGIFRSWEVMLLGANVRERGQMGETAQSVLARYAACLPDPDS